MNELINGRFQTIVNSFSTYTYDPSRILFFLHKGNISRTPNIKALEHWIDSHSTFPSALHRTMAYSVLTFLLIQAILFRVGDLSPCAQLPLTETYTDADLIYSIATEPPRSSNIIRITLLIRRGINDTSWFVLGATDGNRLIGSWQPSTSDDGQVLNCASSFGDAREEIVSNTAITQSYYTFFWMPASTFYGTVTFLATVSVKDPSTGVASAKYIRSSPMTIDASPVPQRYQDVNISA